ncbi:hypothetical protein [Candidatus Binatus sp.]|uniref:hypothetical protein n=1 Tax=Candidatus Binatus sp. TaxID=2811406 RepID=UPI003CC58F44
MKRKRMRRLGILGLAALTALILGFLAKRIMIPSAVHYIAYRAPDQPQPAGDTNTPAASDGQGDNGGSENLTPSDRSQLDAIIKRKAK